MARLNDFNFKQVIRKLTRDRSFPRRLGTLAVNHFKQSFRDEGFTDGSLKKWRKRKNNVDAGRAVLVKSGDLRRSIKIKRASFKSIIVGTTGIPYATIHNEGGSTRFAKMPKRQFIGDSRILEKKLKRRILRQIEKSF
jgi:phage gpG-like protein